jgi:hypothetical protein
MSHSASRCNCSGLLPYQRRSNWYSSSTSTSATTTANFFLWTSIPAILYAIGFLGSEFGTVFKLSVGLKPFVKTQPTSGKVGAEVKILGTKLTGTTSVTFNGTAAVFKVVSKSETKSNVPNGATTGYVTVTTAKGTLKSDVAFRVSK